MRRKTIIAIYDQPEKFPPTLNAIQELVKLNNDVIILYRDTTGDTAFTKQAHFKAIPIKDFSYSTTSAWQKLLFFLRFTAALWWYNLKYKPHFNLVYDCYSFTSFTLAKYLIPSTKLWYHNHDVTDLNYINKRSLTYYCWLVEQKYLHKAEIFSLPDLSRAPFFKYSGDISLLPNYPNLNFNAESPMKNNFGGKMKIIYQGRISHGHGILELVSYISQSNFNISLDIIGSYDPNFKTEIQSLIAIKNLHNKVVLHDPVSYHELMQFTKNFDIGWGVLQPINIAYRTAANASNKIFEYVACAMPVILFDDEPYREALNKYEWAKFTDLSTVSLNDIFIRLKETLTKDSECAYEDYRNHLHFEKQFHSIYQKISI